MSVNIPGRNRRERKFWGTRAQAVADDLEEKKPRRGAGVRGG
jgi:hypothetical protein